MGRGRRGSRRVEERLVFRSCPSAFERVVLPHLDAVYDLALRLTASRDDAQDLVQETVLRALASFATFDGAGSVRAWLFTILRNGARNRWRDAARHPAEPLQGDALEVEPADAAPDWRRFSTEDLEALLPRLSPAAREIVVLRDLHGMSYKDIAAVLDCPVGTVMSRLHRGRVELRRLFLARAGDADRRSAG
jgi:RNA polymerase sigma-70 factor (ECF subfamily)